MSSSTMLQAIAIPIVFVILNDSVMPTQSLRLNHIHQHQSVQNQLAFVPQLQKVQPVWSNPTGFVGRTGRNEATFLCSSSNSNQQINDDKVMASESSESSPPLDDEDLQAYLANMSPSDFVFRGDEDDKLSDEVWEDIQSGKPPEWEVMKALLGVNIFTYILIGLIVISMTANWVLGPGWLGQVIGIENAGTFDGGVSDSLPQPFDLSDPEYLL